MLLLTPIWSFFKLALIPFDPVETVKLMTTHDSLFIEHFVVLLLIPQNKIFRHYFETIVWLIFECAR